MDVRFVLVALVARHRFHRRRTARGDGRYADVGQRAVGGVQERVIAFVAVVQSPLQRVGVVERHRLT